MVRESDAHDIVLASDLPSEACAELQLVWQLTTLAICTRTRQRQYPCNDFNTTAWIARVLDAEEPDLVVFTGDNLAGGMPDPELSIRLYSQEVVNRQIPWVCRHTLLKVPKGL